MAQALSRNRSRVTLRIFTASFTLTGLTSSHTPLQSAHGHHFSNQRSVTTFGVKLDVANQLKMVVQSRQYGAVCCSDFRGGLTKQSVITPTRA